MDRNLLNEQLAQQMREAEEEMLWLRFNEGRNTRWAHMFGESEDLSDREQSRLQLENDPRIKALGLSQEEIDRRRWITEFGMDVMQHKVNQLEARVKQGSPFLESNTTSNIAAFTTWALPMVRKLWPFMFLHNITSVQPMAQATGKYFVMDYQYGTAGGTYSIGDSIFPNEDPAYANDLGEGVEPREVQINIAANSITAISKKLKFVWTIELEQDAASYFNVVVENEGVKAMAMEIEREVNRYCINQIVANATTNTNWSSTQPTGTNPWANATPKQFAASIWDAIEDANKEIKDRIYRPANFILCGTTFANRLRKLNGFTKTNVNDMGISQTKSGPNLFGTLDGDYMVYEDPFFTADKALIGHKGADWAHTGSVFLPYVPAWMTEKVATTAMTFGKGYLTRFAFVVTNGDFYATVTVT